MDKHEYNLNCISFDLEEDKMRGGNFQVVKEASALVHHDSELLNVPGNNVQLPVQQGDYEKDDKDKNGKEEKE